MLVLRYLSVHLCPERARVDARGQNLSADFFLEAGFGSLEVLFAAAAAMRLVALLCVLARASGLAQSSADRNLVAPGAGSLESSDDTGRSRCDKCGGGSTVASLNCCRSGGSWEGTCAHLPSDGAAHTWVEGWNSCHPEAGEFRAKEPDWRRKALKEGTFKRLVYNRVPKAGSSLMDNLIHKLSQRNNFSFVQDTDYLPNASALAERIAALPEGDVYINHAGFDATAPADVVRLACLPAPALFTCPKPLQLAPHHCAGLHEPGS